MIVSNDCYLCFYEEPVVAPWSWDGPVKIKGLISKDTHSQSLRQLFILLTFCLSSDHTEQEADSSFPGSSGKSLLLTCRESYEEDKPKYFSVFAEMLHGNC